MGSIYVSEMLLVSHAWELTIVSEMQGYQSNLE